MRWALFFTKFKIKIRQNRNSDIVKVEMELGKRKRIDLGAVGSANFRLALGDLRVNVQDNESQDEKPDQFILSPLQT